MLSLLFAGVVGAAGAAPQLEVITTRLGTSLRVDKGPAIHTTRAQVRNPRLIDVPGTGQRLAVWEEIGRAGATPYYSILLDGRTSARTTPTTYELKFRYSHFDPQVRVPQVPAALKAREESSVYVVQFETQPLEEFRDAISAAGGEISYYVPEHAYIVRMDDEARERVARLPYVRWIGPYEPAYRIDPALRGGVLDGTLPSQRYNVQVYQYGWEQKRRVGYLIEMLGGEIDELGEHGYVLVATLSAPQLRLLLQSDDVFYVDKWSPLEPDLDIARAFSGANFLETVPGFAGQGVRGQVRDGGVRTTHSAFASRPLIIRSNTASTSHGTPCTGIIFGDGAGFPQGRGILPFGQGVFISNPGASFPPIGSQRYNETLDAVNVYNCLFESNSTGNVQVLNYTTASFGMDDILYRMNLIICQSQSNTGNQTSRPEAWAKNIVSVGGIVHNNTLTRADDSWGGASFGPAEDGRIKPDLAHFYDNTIAPSSSSDASYANFSGTSNATPITAGHFGLLFQMWSEGVFGNTNPASTVFLNRPQWPTAKALMVNTAGQWNLAGTITRMRQGWGAADVQNMYNLRDRMFIVNQTDLLQNLQSRSYRLFVPSSTPALKATMVYKDPPGTTSATQHRINDLTLRVTDPAGTVYYGNNGLVTSLWSSPGGSPNIKDTVENVFVQNPVPGVWTVEVSAPQIVQDGELSTGAMDAGYGLVVSGVIAELVPTSISAGPASLVSGILADLYTSNNQFMRWGPEIVFGGSGNPGPHVVLASESPTASLQELRLRLENRPSRIGSIVSVSFFDYSANQYVQVHQAVLPDSENVVLASAGNASRFVHPTTREIKARLSFSALQQQSGRQTHFDVDQVRWQILP